MYRRRRLLALLLVVVVLAGAVTGGRLLWQATLGDDPVASASGGAAAAGSGQPRPAAAGDAVESAAIEDEAGAAGAETDADTLVPQDLEACTPDAVQVLAAADATSYAADAQPVLSAVVRARNGAEPCSVVLEPDSVELVVSSDGERVYDSGHCASGGEAEPAVVAPGSEARLDVSWGREHTSPGCPSGMPAAAAGSYEVTATVDGVVSEPLELTLE